MAIEDIDEDEDEDNDVDSDISTPLSSLLLWSSRRGSSLSTAPGDLSSSVICRILYVSNLYSIKKQNEKNVVHIE